MGSDRNKNINRVLQDLTDVLRIHVFLADESGTPVLMPRGEYGWDLLADSWQDDILTRFTPEGPYLTHHDAFQTTTFAVPLNAGGYLVVGPVVLTKKLDKSTYEAAALALGRSPERVMTALDEMRTLSFNNVQSILGLLDGIGHMIAPVKDTYGALLDAALEIAQAESGSILLTEGSGTELTIKACRGLGPEQTAGTRIKIGDGIAGMAYAHNMSFVLDNTNPDSRVKHLLKRPDIKQSMVLPLRSNDKVVGVLNISTRREGSALSSNRKEILQRLSQFALAF